MASWKTTFLYKQDVFHFHVSESECNLVGILQVVPLQEMPCRETWLSCGAANRRPAAIRSLTR